MSGLIERTRTCRRAAGWLLGVAVVLGPGLSVAGPAGAAPHPASNHLVAVTRPLSARQLLLGQVAAVGSESQQVAEAVEIWGCEQAAASSPGVSSGLGPEAGTHAITTCRPVPPTAPSFPTSAINPGPQEFSTEITFFQGFAAGALSGRWPVTLTRSMTALRQTAAALATQLGTGGNDGRWSSKVRAHLIRLDAQVHQIEVLLER